LDIQKKWFANGPDQSVASHGINGYFCSREITRIHTRNNSTGAYGGALHGRREPHCAYRERQRFCY